MPAPCTNCVLFHYGPCRDPARQCYGCGGWNHLDRYCPNRGHIIRRLPGEPLPGTRAWYEFHGLNDDPRLKSKILQALKTDPGSAIHVNGVCIYGGITKTFSTNVRSEQPRGRTLEERITSHRPRSLSPARDGNYLRGRAPSPSPPRGPRGYQPRYRSRSPLRQRARSPSPYRQLLGRPRTPSPYRQSQYRARSPRYAPGSSAIVFEARDRQSENRRPENHPQRSRESGRLTPVRFNFPPPPNASRPGPPPAFNAPPARAPLGQVSSNLPKGDQMMFDAPKQPSQSTARSETMFDNMDDPYFVLGIEKGASEAK
jgi:hypothetical protein